jgi:hypothetical protein
MLIVKWTSSPFGDWNVARKLTSDIGLIDCSVMPIDLPRRSKSCLMASATRFPAAPPTTPDTIPLGGPPGGGKDFDRKLAQRSVGFVIGQTPRDLSLEGVGGETLHSPMCRPLSIQ